MSTCTDLASWSQSPSLPEQDSTMQEALTGGAITRQSFCSAMLARIVNCQKSTIEWFDPVWFKWLFPEFQPFSSLAAFSLSPQVALLQIGPVVNAEHLLSWCMWRCALWARLQLPNHLWLVAATSPGHLVPSGSVTTPPAPVASANILPSVSQPSRHSLHNQFSQKKLKNGRASPSPDYLSDVVERVRERTLLGRDPSVNLEIQQPNPVEEGSSPL